MCNFDTKPFYFHLSVVWLLAVSLLSLTACDTVNTNESYQFSYSGMTMGTRFNIKVPILPEGVDTDKLKKQVQQCLHEIDARMSTYLEDSELSEFNQNVSTDWQPVSRALYDVLNEAQRISRLSDGAFDITVGPLVNLWGFGPDPMVFEPPADSAIQALLEQTGYHYLKLKEKPLSVRKENPELYLDLSALAKGYAVDRVAGLLEEQGISDFLVEIGGELSLRGHNIQRQPWRIAIEKPAADKRMIQRVLSITNIAIATSGDYRNFFETGGIRFSHTIDPRTGRPIRHKLASVTVLRETTMEADALATALMVLGPDDGFRLAEQEQIAALFIIKPA